MQAPGNTPEEQPEEPGSTTDEATPEFGPDDIQAWAVDHPTRAKALGLRLIQSGGDKEALEGLESLGEFEDTATEWAIKNPFKAKLLILSMVGMFKS